MKSIADIAGHLRASLAASRITQARLRESAGVSQRTLTHVLSGRKDFKLSTLLALADRLGLELVMMPRAAAAAMPPSGVEVSPPQVKSRVQAALEKSSIRAGDAAAPPIAATRRAKTKKGGRP